jgi:hypothetical protein
MDADAIVWEEPDQLLARAGAVLVWVSRNKLGLPEPLGRVRAALEEHALNNPQGVALLLIAVGEGDLPKLSNRRRIAKGLASLGDRLQAVAAVFEGDKPWLVNTRALFDGILDQLEALTDRSRFPIHAFADRIDAIVWLTGVVLDYDQRPIETDELTQVVELACARINPA